LGRHPERFATFPTTWGFPFFSSCGRSESVERHAPRARSRHTLAPFIANRRREGNTTGKRCWWPVKRATVPDVCRSAGLSAYAMMFTRLLFGVAAAGAAAVVPAVVSA